ncbi:hypothetical protein AMD00_02755 [Viridibacillus arvi]|uniref:Uncharacterized protein n=1 Tax=Viridibacillus arvi TaxID=263475 RepID=A0A0M0LNJ8_9BACL|nr:hypothetical protein AMD00_02755 [Viridibacillus arvi]
MSLEIGFIPKGWISNIPNASGFFPFAVDGKKEYIVDFTFIDEPLDFVSNWMNELSQFPIYILVEVYDFDQEELEQDCKTHKIEFEKTKNKNYFYKIIIENQKQFSIMFPYVYGNGGMNNLALWSLKRDVFSFGEREVKTFFGIKKNHTTIVTLLESDCVFWVGFDGDTIVAITNDRQFSTIENISDKLPHKTNFIITEYAD